jgi:hypothetical protein
VADPQQHQENHPAGKPGITWCSKNPGCSQGTPCDECQALADGRLAEVHLVEYRHHHVRVPWAALRQAWLADQPLYLPDPGAADDPQPGWLGGDEEPRRHVWAILQPVLDDSAADGELGAIRIREVTLESPEAAAFTEALALWLAAGCRLREIQARAADSQPAPEPANGEGPGRP